MKKLTAALVLSSMVLAGMTAKAPKTCKPELTPHDLEALKRAKERRERRASKAGNVTRR